MCIECLCQACEATLNLENAALSPSYYYDSLPQGVIDAVFSIGVKYTSTTNVVKSYCACYGLRAHNESMIRKVINTPFCSSLTTLHPQEWKRVQI